MLKAEYKKQMSSLRSNLKAIVSNRRLGADDFRKALDKHPVISRLLFSRGSRPVSIAIYMYKHRGC